MRSLGLLSMSVVLLIAFPAGATPPDVETTAIYLPSLLVLGVSCSAQSHPWVPDGDPEDHSSPIGWAVSGEPECAAHDLHNDLRERQGEERAPGGYGAVAAYYTDEYTGATATATPQDAVFGEEVYLTLRASAAEPDEDATSEGCGVRSITLPQPISHAPPGPSEEALMWAFIPEVGVDDDLTVCFATLGELHFHWGF